VEPEETQASHAFDLPARTGTEIAEAFRTTLSRPARVADRLRLEELALVLLFVTISYDNLNLVGMATSGGGIDVTLAKLFTLLALGLWAGRALLVRDQRLVGVLGQNTTSYFVFAFLAISAISNVSVAGLEIVPGAPGPWTLFLRRVMLVMFYFLLVAVIRNRRIMDYAILGYVIGGLLDCYAGSYEMITGEQFLDALPWGRSELIQTAGGAVRVQGIESDADVHATFLLLGVAFIPYLWHRAVGAWKAGVVLLGALYVVNLIGAGAKGGWAGLVFALGIYLVLAEDRHKWRIVGLAGAAGLVAFIVLSFNTNLLVGLEKIFGHSYSNSIRVGLIRMAWEMVKDNPILGAGTGAFGFEYHRYYVFASNLVPNRPWPPCNAYMQVWAENGTIGLAIFLLLFGTTLLELWTAMRNAADPLTRMLGVTLFILFVCTAWVIAIFPIMDSKYMWMGLGLAVAYANLPETQPRARGPAGGSGPTHPGIPGRPRDAGGGGVPPATGGHASPPFRRRGRPSSGS
jgi:O-antigen ligase